MTTELSSCDRRRGRDGARSGPRPALQRRRRHARAGAARASDAGLAEGAPDIDVDRDRHARRGGRQRPTPATSTCSILDGEAAKSGGMGLCRQLKHEVFDCPPVLVLTGRAAGRLARVVVARRRRARAPARPGRAPAGRRGPGHGADRARMTSPTWSDVLTALVGGRDLTAGADVMGDGRGHGRQGVARAPRRVPRRAAVQGRDGRRSSPRWPTRCWRTPCGSRCPAGRSTSSGPAGTARTR